MMFSFISSRILLNAVGRLTVLFAAAVLVGVHAADWPQFLGPGRDGIAPKSPKLARKWPPQGPKVLWRVPVGKGFAGPAVCRGCVLFLDREDDARDVLRCLALKTGREIWRTAYDAPGKLPYNGSRSTPAADGKLVFTIGPFGHILATRFDTGKPVWRANLVRDWQSRRPHWGFSQSPLILGNRLIIAPWGKKAAVVAYDKKTGRILWTTPNPKHIGQDYTSPAPMTLDGRQMIVSGGRKAYIIGVDPETGKQLWEYSEYTCRLHIPSPTVLEDGRILLTGGYHAGSAMFKVERQGDRYITRTLWKSKNMGSKIPQPLVYKNAIYANSSDNRKGLICLTLDDKLRWQTGRPGFDMGDVLLADGLLFIVDGKNGQLVMAEATPERYHELGRASLLKGPRIWAPMAFTDGLLILRDQHTMVCVDLR